ncbi:MAG: YqaJ viral recombinase family protein [Planctomycetaceae bacterium]|nr:YqaJ viral recombinase family protein [Planctomycetaceae bacterium]
MPITAEQRRQRQKYLCASDSPIILGLSPFKKTPGDIYFSKIYDLPDDASQDDYLQTGNYLENPLLDWAADQLGGVQLERQPWFVCKDGPAKDVFAAHPDAVIVGKRAGIEAKYCNAAMSQDYGDEGTDSIPAHVIVQAQHQMVAAELDEVWVPVAMAGFALTFKLFHVPRDQELIDQIVTKGMDWWTRHIVAKVPPDGEETPPIDILKRIRREPSSIVDLPADAEKLIFEYQQAGYQNKENDDLRDELKARIVSLLGEAEAGRLPDGRLVTFMEQNCPPRTDTKLLRAEHPDLYEKYVTCGTTRVLRIKEPKKAKGEGFSKLVA